MFGKALYRYAYAQNQVYRTVVDNVSTLGFFVPTQVPNHYIAGVGNTAAIINWDGHSARASRVGNMFAAPSGASLNGLLVSPTNDLYTGTFTPRFCAAPPSQSILGYLRNRQLVNFGGQLVASFGEVLIGTIFYYIDPCTRTLFAFNWNPANGHFGKQRNCSLHLHSLRNRFR